jgi:hypothetical protein
VLISDFQNLAEKHGAVLTFGTAAVAVFKGRAGVELTLEFPMVGNRLALSHAVVISALRLARNLVQATEPVEN